MKQSLRKHEMIGLLMLFIAGTCFGIGLYITIWGANRPLFHHSIDYLIKGKELLIFPLFYGTAALLWALGWIELKEAKPGRKNG